MPIQADMMQLCYIGARRSATKHTIRSRWRCCNFFIIVGLRSGVTFRNVPHCAEQIVEFIADLIGQMEDKSLSRC